MRARTGAWEKGRVTGKQVVGRRERVERASSLGRRRGRTHPEVVVLEVGAIVADNVGVVALLENADLFADRVEPLVRLVQRDDLDRDDLSSLQVAALETEPTEDEGI